MANFALNHTLILSLLLVLLVSLLVPLMITEPKSKPTSRESKDKPLKMATTTTTEMFGVKIEKNPPESKISELGVTSWPKWGCPPSKFPWTFTATETMYLLEGKVKVYVDGYEGSFEIGAGDLVVFPKGMKITWDVIEAVNKHYSLEKERSSKKRRKMSNTSSPLIVCFGEMLIDFVPNVSGVSLAESTGFLKAPGGAPANVACAITKLGGNSAFIGKFGDDEFGHMLVQILKKNGVKSEGVCFDQHARTALAFVTLKHNGEREFMFYRNPSADMLLKDSELNMGLIKQARIFHYGSISLISEPCRSAHMAAMKAAKEGGILLSYDPNLRLPLWPSADAARDGIKSIWNYADFIKVSDEEVKFLTNGGDPEKDDVVMSLWHDNLKLLLVTYGEKGSGYFNKKFKGKVAGFSVKTVDTTGAGDSFVGSFLVSVAKDPTILNDEVKLKEALTFANACGAICTTQKGAIPALPTHAAALDLVKSDAK